MAKDFRNLAVAMDKIADAVEKDVIDLGTAIASSVHEAVVQGTPVDVGTARSNWIVRLGSPWGMIYRAFSPLPSRWKPPYAPGPGRAETGNYGAALRQAQGVLARRKTEQPIYITNNLPYIARLNQGYSRQAPSGYVETAVTFGVRRALSQFKFNNLNKVR